MFCRIGSLFLLASLAIAQKEPAHQHEMNHAMNAMSSKHMDMGPHMKLTELREVRPGDEQRAEAVADIARETMSRYADYKAALADGYRIFLPNVPMKMYHFTNYWYAVEAAFRFNPEHPTSLLYEKAADGGYRLIGVTYTAPAKPDTSALDSRIPLSIPQWHEHVNLCQAPKGPDREA